MTPEEFATGTRVRVRRDPPPGALTWATHAGRQGVVVGLEYGGFRVPAVRVRFDRYGEPTVLFHAEELEIDPDASEGTAV